MAPIGSLCSLENGRAFKPTEWTTRGLPIVRIQNLNNPNAPFNYFNGQFESKYHLRGGELLFAWSGTPGTSFGAHVWQGEEAVLNQHIFRVDFDEKVLDKRFFRYAINQKLDELINIAHGGVGLRHVTKGKFEKTEVALPPFNEQKRIADKLDTLLARVDACRERLDRVPLILKSFRQAVLAAATSGQLTEEWRTKEKKEPWLTLTIRDICEQSFYGPRFGKNEYTHDGLPTIRTTDMTGDGRIELHPDTPKVKVPPAKIEQFLLRRGDLLVTRTGSIGVMAVFDDDYLAIPSAYLIRFRFIKQVLSRYVLFCLMAPGGQEALGLSATAITQPNINAEAIKRIQIRVPSIEEQHEIIRRVETLFSFADRLEARYNTSLDQVERLVPALLAKAFCGELVPQDLTDEPASALLARIRTARAAQTAKPRHPKTGRRSRMAKITAETVKDAIQQLPKDTFSFDELRDHTSGDYDTVKDILFTLLDETEPSVQQIFDREAQAIRLVRVHT